MNIVRLFLTFDEFIIFHSGYKTNLNRMSGPKKVILHKNEEIQRPHVFFQFNKYSFDLVLSREPKIDI